MCVWNGPARDVQGGLLFHVKDWDRFGSNDDLGTILVPAETLWKLDATTTPAAIEYPITAPKGVTQAVGFLTLNIRHATAADREKYHCKTSAAMAKFWTPIKAVAEKITPHHAVKPKEPTAPAAVEPAKPAAQAVVEPTVESTGVEKAVPSLLIEEPVIVGNPATAAAPAEADAPAPTTTTATSTDETTQVIPTEDKDIHIEIVSARNLLAADRNGLSDPYVKIKLGGKDLHETKVIKKT